jgi:isoleucyl-tRNA synthetase
MVVQIVELGRVIRKEHKLRVRQPLSRLSVALKSEKEGAWLNEFEDQILDELNIKEISALDNPAELVTYRVKPNFRLLGPRFGKRVPQLGKLLGAMDAAELARQCRAGEAVALELDGEAVELKAEEIDVQMDAAEGLAVADEGGYLVALSTELSPELLREGMARDMSRGLNDLRRKADYNVADRIVVEWSSDSTEVQTAMREFAEFIKREALAVEIRQVGKPSGDQTMQLEFEGGRVVDLGVGRA